jgi:hypothetical protein
MNERKKELFNGGEREIRQKIQLISSIYRLISTRALFPQFPLLLQRPFAARSLYRRIVNSTSGDDSKLLITRETNEIFHFNSAFLRPRKKTIMMMILRVTHFWLEPRMKFYSGRESESARRQ